MSQNNSEAHRSSGVGDIGNGSPSNYNLVGDGSRNHNQPSAILMGSSPTNTNNTNTTTGGNHRPSHSGSDHELTLKDRQDAINTTHPFGFSLWKPALYKKSRSVTRNANSALHSTPSSDFYLYPGNILWAIRGGYKYARVLRELCYYIFWPFGKYVERSEVEYEEWFAADEVLRRRQRQQQERVGNMNHNDFFIARDTSMIITGIERAGGSEVTGDYTTDEEANSERRPLLGRFSSYERNRRINLNKFNLFKTIREIGFAGVVFYFCNTNNCVALLAPMFLLISTLCWLCIFSIPMAKLTFVLSRHLRKYPLSLHFKPGSSLSLLTNQRSLILLCTYKAFDYCFLTKIFEDYFFTTQKFLFTLSLISVIPLSYFIGMAVASISAQSSAGLGAVINATFGSIVEIILYAITLVEGKGKVAEGSIIGSLMAGVLLMPGVSMISSGFKRKEQKFNAKSAGVTSTMLIMAIIGALTPTLFFQTYAPYKMTCVPCKGYTVLTDECQLCTHDQVNPTSTPLYKERVKPLMLFCSVILVLSYVIGLWFTLRTHAALVWQTGHHPNTFVDNTNTRSTSIYKKIVPEYILQQLLPHPNPHDTSSQHLHPSNPHSNSLYPSSQNASNTPSTSTVLPQRPNSVPGPSSTTNLQHNIHNLDHLATLTSQGHFIPSNASLIRFAHEPEEEEEPCGHDSPNWSKVKSGIVLLSCTALYSLIAEILVGNVEVILNNFTITEKFLGLTLFALVPNVTEFVNAMSFALYGNIALSMEIGSAYALQVCLLQIPAMVAFSAWYNADRSDEEDISNNTFTLVFPRWDVFSVVFSVFLLTYTYIEGKSNYFKGSILILSYSVLMAGFFYAPDNDNIGLDEIESIKDSALKETIVVVILKFQLKLGNIQQKNNLTMNDICFMIKIANNRLEINNLFDHIILERSYLHRIVDNANLFGLKLKAKICKYWNPGVQILKKVNKVSQCLNYSDDDSDSGNDYDTIDDVMKKIHDQYDFLTTLIKGSNILIASDGIFQNIPLIGYKKEQ
ncbi:8561_t:CDS:10 [Funneliformis geosporum]|uniref:8561_t:CDS:1 n=1 Tax=Funneliformis geosporum TaxID=1117311 RepID=A0A9W4SU29_9GLOM|nr:8561_t:CDS:10 [Funneliformis geosporum]